MQNEPRSVWESICLTVGVILATFIIGISLISYYTYYDPNVLADKTFTPGSHALGGIVAILPGNGTYCVNAETLSRGEPVTVGLHYIVQVPTTSDRFGATRNEQRGAVFTTDNDHVVNETVVVPEGATDAIITASYSGYSDTNQVHVKVRKCNSQPPMEG